MYGRVPDWEDIMDKETALSILRSYLKENAERHGIRCLGLFGSLARGEATSDSDVDVVVEVDRVNFVTLVQIQEELSEQLGASVDLVRKRDAMTPLLRQCLEEDAVYA